jgi:hypothetical protein
LAVAVREGRLERAEVSRFLTECFERLEPRAFNFAWVGWQEAIAVLGLDELVPLVRQAFERAYIDEIIMDFSDFEEDLAKFHNDPESLVMSRSFVPLESAIEHLAAWGSWGNTDEEDEDYDHEHDEFNLESLRLDEPEVLPRQAINPYRDVGRNDPCPCGSGKKFKRCCLQRCASQPAAPRKRSCKGEKRAID